MDLENENMIFITNNDGTAESGIYLQKSGFADSEHQNQITTQSIGNTLDSFC